MTKFYTVTGKSTERPASLPDGFEVEETDDGVIFAGCCGEVGDFYGARVSMRHPGLGVEISLRAGESPWNLDDGMSFDLDGAKALRDALIELIGDGPKTAPAVVNHGDPEPPRDAVYIEDDGSEWSFGSNGWDYSRGVQGRGRFSWEQVTTSWSETFPWTLKTT